MDGEDLDNFVADDRVNARIRCITVATVRGDHILFVENELGFRVIRPMYCVAVDWDVPELL